MSEGSDESAVQGGAAAMERQPAAVDGQPESPKWGELPPPERIAELEARIAAWNQQEDPEFKVGTLLGPFDTGPGVVGLMQIGWRGKLTGADVFYLAARALVGSTERSLLAEAFDRLLNMTDVQARLSLSLSALHLEGADLTGAHLEGADLTGAHLEGADLSEAHLGGAYLTEAHLEGAGLPYAELQGVDLRLAHLEGTFLNFAQLQGADLTGCFFDKASRLNDAVLTDVSFDQVIFDNANLAVVDWSIVDILGDERRARERKRPGVPSLGVLVVHNVPGVGSVRVGGNPGSYPKSRDERLYEYKAAVRANRILAVALQAQGLAEDAARFAYRAQVLQRRVYRLQGFRKVGAYLFSLLVAALAGYGHRLWRIALTYGLVVTLFALGYYVAGTTAFEETFRSLTSIPLLSEQHVPLHEAFLLSVTNIHGRVFTGTFLLASLQAWFAAAEALCGLVIEGVFVAMLIQRFFGR